MNCWKKNFNKTTLKQGLKYKNNIGNISYDGYTFKAIITSKNEFNVELVLQDNLLFDMSCSCSKKSSCAHEAGVLYFLEEFPEILEDFTDDSEHEKISDIDISADLKVISESKLKKFLKKEFKKDPKLKYSFIKQFSTESLIDSKAYERKLKRILRNGGKEFGYYKLHNMRTPLKNFVKKDICTLIEQKEYKLAYRLLNEIMDLFIDQVYWDDDAWYEIAYYYREYIYFLLENGEFSNSERLYVKRNLSIINDIVL
ncbi:hypothetical protein [uncultured Methanobrevibacter sp.]|uniref:hypothetical protein n=1 Tax=uncultured Methanobrevibacter sp. TaxID=253161 RepID=UPI0025D6EAB6|nr:hypothetical protein [uncultured Methanobrevibacter sp.]